MNSRIMLSRSVLPLLAALILAGLAVFARGAPVFASETAAQAGARWIDVNLSRQTATAYVGQTPTHVAFVSTGKPGWRTPTGTFHISKRVYNETMDSATLGVPRNSAEGYYLRDIYFTQYFAPGGVALHYNWWSPRSVFGRQPTSHGCVGMGWSDAAYFWDFATYGTTVVVHY